MLRAACIVLWASTTVASAQVSQTWTLNVDQSPLSDWMNAADVQPDGTTTFVGSWKLQPDGTGSEADGTVARVSPQGALLWLQRYTTPPGAPTFFRDVAVAPNGNCFATGNTGFHGTVTAAYSPSGTLLW